jgi:hypothetical protein
MCPSVKTRYEELSQATTVEEVLSVTSSYLSTWTRQELDALPEDCRPATLTGPGDIESWADRLLDATRASAFIPDEGRRLDRMTSHFMIAAVRIRRLPSVRLATPPRLTP